MISLNKRVWFLSVVALLLLCDAALLLSGASLSSRPGSAKANAEAVRALGLTDLALWTEARYTRHPGLTDFFSPFQDLPGGMEHFPAGALLAPPSHLTHKEVDGENAGVEPGPLR